MLLWWLPLFATLLAGLTLFLNFQNISRLERYINVEDRATELQHQENVESRIQTLENDRAALQRELNLLSNKATSNDANPQPENNTKPSGK
jgi:TolA-binding protein